MAWIDEANKHVNEPGVVFGIVLDSGTQKYSIDIIRPTDAKAIKGNILKLPVVSSSIGGILRTLEFSRVVIELDDTDYALRTLIGSGGEGLKNKVAWIKVPFIALDLTITAKTIFTGRIYTATHLQGLRFQIECEPNLKNITNKYPEKTVEIGAGNYANAPAGIPGTLILEPYGEITDFGGANKGAWKAIMVDDTIGSEIHLVGRQKGANVGEGEISVPRVRLNGDIKAPGPAADYEIVTREIETDTWYTEIQWTGAGASPTIEDTVTCDIQFGTREICEMWRHYLVSFCEYDDGTDFDEVSYDIAHAKGISRGYIAKGAFREQKELVSLRDDICREFDFDIWWEPKDGLIHFNFLSSLVSPTVHYYDYKDILEGYVPNNDATKIINYQRVGYNWDYSIDNFRNYTFRENVPSQTKYGGTFKGDFKRLQFVRDSSVANDLAVRVLILRKDPIALEEFPLPIKGMDVDLSDVLQITHFDGKGAEGYVGATFQLRKTVYDLDKFIAKLHLLDYSSFIGGAFILGPASLVEWTLESEANKLKYGFVCKDDGSEEMSDGSEAKRLRD